MKYICWCVVYAPLRVDGGGGAHLCDYTHTHNITVGARPGLGQRCGLVSLGAFIDIGTLTGICIYTFVYIDTY